MLLLFDIDGTLLIDAAREHAAAIHEALRTVHGVRRVERRGMQVAGRTDADIARNLLVHAGVPARAIDERADDVRIAACEAYARLCPPDLSGHVAPGMGELVERLAQRDDTLLALVTGNFEPIARMKLKAAGIGRFFPGGQGGFGSDHEDRAMLPQIARRRAGDSADGDWPRAHTVVIGDTPRDIACARADGVRVAAVATGPYGPKQLREADGVARDAGELGVLLDRWLAARARLPR
ncbi:MAG TPA: haloacid dehalogenase-like hydrolase [Solirubrobacteraceae bacterium]|nr:haloacid dehalogenase-like hydrolase [Solirubrobacteraceae bacterium]